MLPTINIFGKVITSYAIMALIGILVLIFLCIKWAKRFKVSDNDLIFLIIWGFIGGLIGSHLLYGLVNFNLIINFFKNLSDIDGFQSLINALYNIFGGSVFYGGLIGALIAGVIYLKVKKLDIKLYSYIVTPMIPLFHVFGRIGCFLSGCCYGIESKFGFVFHNSLIESANGVRRFPVQLVEAGFNLGLFILLYILQVKNKCRDYLLELYILLYSIGRFILEFFRGDYYRGFLWGLSTSQLISIILFIISLTSIIIKSVKKAQNK